MTGAITLTLNPHDRLTLATTIERLINMLDDLEPDEDLEPSLGWTERGPDALANGLQDDREDDGDDLEPTGDESDYDGGECDGDVFIWGGGEDGKKPDLPGYR